MIKVRNISAIYQKQWKDTLKNTQVLFIFFLYPLMTFVMTTALPSEAGTIEFFVSTFATMHIVFTPLTGLSSVIAEEKEKNTLRVLIMSNVKPTEYLIGIGIFMFFGTFVGSLLFPIMAGYTGIDFVFFVMVEMIGIVISMLLGAIIGILSKNQMSVNTMAVPIAIVLAFVPMLSSFNGTIRKISVILYSQSICDLLSRPKLENITWKPCAVILITFFLFLSMFIIVFKKNNLDD